MQEGAVGVATILAAPVGVDDKVRGRRLGEKGPLQGRVDQFLALVKSLVQKSHLAASRLALRTGKQFEAPKRYFD